MKPRIAFYAPIKPPDHDIPSGDREIARLMVRALEGAGYNVEIASRYIAYQKRPSKDVFCERKHGALNELARLRTEWKRKSANERPKLWFTYHPYCKAVDWIGPAMAEEFGIAYVTAEACRTRQATGADWAEARQQVQSAIQKAAINFCLKKSDLAYLKSFMANERSIRPLAPFVDLAELNSLDSSIPDTKFAESAEPLLVVVGMMRPGAKTDCFRMLAGSLEKVANEAWNLVIVGDGPSRPEIEAAFSWAEPSRLHWTGEISRAEVLAWFRRGDLFVWPGYREAIGMVFMEAQSQGLPVAAYASLGVPLVVRHEQTGILVPESDQDAHSEAVKALLRDRNLRDRYAMAAKAHIAGSHDIKQAIKTFQDAIGPLITQ